MLPRSAAPADTLTRSEWTCLLGLLALIALAALLPAIAQPCAYHAFADSRALGAAPNAANVLSSLGFAVVGIAIALGLRRAPPAELPRATRHALLVAAAGLLLTAAGSAYYHAMPADAPLLWDRLPLTAVFAGIVGAALAQRVSARSGTFATIVLLLLGPAGALYWRASGNLMPYVVLQAGAMLALPLIVLLLRRRDDPMAWWWLIGWYAVAKLAEYFDTSVFTLTDGFVSGHTLKHLLGAMAAAGLAYPLWRTPKPVAASI